MDTSLSLMRALSVVFLLALAACDSQAPDPTSSTALDAPPLFAASVAESEAYFVTEATRVGTEGEAVVLTIGGDTYALGAGEAYLLGQALARAGFVSLDPELAAGIRPPTGGDRCEPPPPGGAVALIDGRLYGGGECPPPPPPFFMETGLLDGLFGGYVEVVEAPDGVEWLDLPGGFVAEF